MLRTWQSTGKATTKPTLTPSSNSCPPVLSPDTAIQPSHQPPAHTTSHTLQQHTASCPSTEHCEQSLHNCLQQPGKHKTWDSTAPRVYPTLAVSVESSRLTVETLSSFISERRIAGMKSKRTFQMLSQNVKALFTLKYFREFIPTPLPCHIIYPALLFQGEPQSAEFRRMMWHSQWPWLWASDAAKPPLILTE